MEDCEDLKVESDTSEHETIIIESEIDNRKNEDELVIEFKVSEDEDYEPSPKKKKSIDKSKESNNKTKSKKDSSNESKIFYKKYRDEWEANPEFKSFISRSFKSDYYFFCRNCQNDYACGVTEILRHMKSQKHIKNSKLQVKLKNVKFEGLLCPVFTPYMKSKELEVEYASIAEYAEILKYNNVKGVLINDIIGEGMTLSCGERINIAEEWSKACAKSDLYLMVQVGGAPLRDVQRMVKHAEKINAKSIVVLPDLYNRPKDHYDLLRYMKTISIYADTLPLLYHHNPSYSNVNIDVVQFLRDANEIKSFVGIIYNGNNLAEATSALYVNENFSVIMASDEIILASSLSGFNSIMSTALNFVPKIVQEIIKSVNIQDAKKAQKRLNDIIYAIKQKGHNVASMKSAMNLLSINVGGVREPLIYLWQDKLKTLEKELKWLEAV